MITVTIEILKSRLGEKARQFADPTQTPTKFTKPHRLMQSLAVIERKFDEIENAQPLDEKIFKSLTKLKEYGSDYLTKRDWKNLAWSLSKKLPERQEKVLFSEDGRLLVEKFTTLPSELMKVVYFPLLYSYFAVEQQEIDYHSGNWIKLRKLLTDSRSKLFQLAVGRPKPWLLTLTDYPEVLSTEPTKNFVKEFLEHNDSKIVAKRLESLRISSNSWFWESLIRATVSSVQKMNDIEYFKAIPRFIALSEDNKLYTTVILAELLKRYAVSSQRTIVHESLKQLALEQWGNPQYASSAGWNNVDIATKQMVIQWFVRVDLEAFFNLFSRTADVNRFNYWIKFIDKISFSQIFLGSSAWNSRQDAQQKFIKQNKSRLKELVGSTGSNNAFMLKIDNVYVIDFSDTGNACFIVNKIPYDEKDKKIPISTLKPYPYLLRLNHSSGWQHRFDQELAKIGIFSADQHKASTGYLKPY